MIRKIVGIVVVFILLFTSFSVASIIDSETEQIKSTSDTCCCSPHDKILTFGYQQDISALDINGKIKHETMLLYQNEKEKTITFDFDISSCKLHQMDIKQVYLEIEGLKPFGLPGNPMIPMKTLTINLPKNSEIFEIGVTDGCYREIENKLRIIPNPQPVFWSKDNINGDTNDEELVNKLLPNMDVYNSDQFFPGTSLSYQVGENNEHTVVLVRIYPVQYIPRDGKAILITNGTLKIFYNEKKSASSSDISIHESTNVIITPPSLFEQARVLKTFHESQGTYTEIVNTTWIDDNCAKASAPPFYGYRDFSKSQKIRKYDYDLARKIISYLNDTSAHNQLKYVTLLGNARLIPPSYYYGSSHYPVPTDFFYASPDCDIIPNYHVGRLPVNNGKEASHVIHKIKNWNATTDLFRNITIAGGRPFRTDFFIGEMITIDSVNQGFLEGSDVVKCFKTEGSFDKENLIHAHEGGSGIVYQIGHGDGRVFCVDGGVLTVNDMLDLPVSDISPIVISIACSNGAYDTHLVNTGFELFKTSFGEAVLLSDAGGIAYIGGSRSNAGIPIYILEDGCVRMIKEPHMAGMLTYVLQAYHEGGETLGQLTTDAMMTYLQHNTLEDPTDAFTFFAFVLLGDPALKIPACPTGEIYQKPHSIAENPLCFIQYQQEGGSMPLGVAEEPFTITSSTDSPTVEIKLIEPSKKDNFIVDKAVKSISENSVSYEFVPDSSSLYSVRTVTEDGKEEWFYVQAVRPVDDDYTSLTPGWQVTRWAEIQDALDNSNECDVVYVFNGTYYENVVLKQQTKLIGENKETTTINGQGQGNVVTIISDSCSISGFTLTNCGKKYSDAAVAIRPKMTRESGFIEIYDNIIKNNKNNGIYVCNTARIFDTGVRIFYNIICNNNRGILLDRMFSSDYIFLNYIDGNNYGIKVTDSKNNFIMSNIISNNRYGIHLEKSDKNFVNGNNFMENTRHAYFCKSLKNAYGGNYWDNWVGLRFNSRLPLPKIIPGRIGMGLIPWINIDPKPAITPNNIL